MLLNSFFEILSTSNHEDKILVKVKLKRNHSIYDGHFPGNPVVPGVCLIQMIREVIEVLQNQKLRLDGADEVKFLNIVNPLISEILTIEIKKRTNTDNPLAFNVIVTDESKVYIKMKADFSVYQSV